MVQFYFLSILLNVITGYALVSHDTEAKGTKYDAVRELLKDTTFRLVLGILCFVVGFFKLLTVMGGGIPVIGDFLPSICGLVAGFTLLLEFYRSNSNVTTDGLEKLDNIFVTNRKVIGYATLVSGAIHFLFANVLFL